LGLLAYSTAFKIHDNNEFLQLVDVGEKVRVTVDDAIWVYNLKNA